MGEEGKGGGRINKETNKKKKKDTSKRAYDGNVGARLIDYSLASAILNGATREPLLLRFLERSYEIESDRESFSPIRILRVRCLIHLVDELVGTSRFHEYIVGRITPTHTHTHTGARTRRGSLERSRVVISARSVRTLSPYRINE